MLPATVLWDNDGVLVDSVVRLLDPLEVVSGDAERPESEVSQCRDHATCVLRIGPDVNVNVAGEARRAVERKRVPTDNQVCNLMRV